MGWVIGLLAGIVIGYLLDREIYFYEGVHLGPRVQAWLYDRWAKKYEVGKREGQLRDNEMLARPLLNLLKDVASHSSWILQQAPGDYRLPCSTNPISMGTSSPSISLRECWSKLSSNSLVE